MSEAWQARPEAGGPRLQRFLLAVARRGGRRVAMLILALATPYIMCVRGPERRASRAYLQRVLGRPPYWWQVMKHQYRFALNILDRVYLLTDGARDFQFEVEGLPHLVQALAGGQGVLLLGAHLGSFEALRTLGQQCPQAPLHIVLDKQQTPALTDLMASLDPDLAERIIDASKGGTTVALAMAAHCAQGGMVALLADRGRAEEATREASFFGRKAPFPVGPWLLASSLKVPVLLCLGLYQGGNRYRLVFEPLADRIEIPRAQRAEALDRWIGHYAARLEHFAALTPYNWFNLYDFWDSSRVSGSVMVDPRAGQRLNV